MRCRWDTAKDRKLRADPKRGFGLEVMAEIFNHPYYHDQKSDDPEQYRAIGFVGGQLMTLIFEQREDEHGEYYHFITYWRSTKAERGLYEKG